MRRMSGQPQTLSALPPGKEPPAPIAQETRWASSQVIWTFCSRQKSVDSAITRNPTVQPVASLLCRLRYHEATQAAATGSRRKEPNSVKARRKLQSACTFLSPSSDGWNQISKAVTCECNLFK